MLRCTLEVDTGSAGGGGGGGGGRERLKEQASEPSQAGVWGGEGKGPFPSLVHRSGRFACPFFVLFCCFFSISPQLFPFLLTTEPGPRPAIDGFCVFYCAMWHVRK